MKPFSEICTGCGQCCRLAYLLPDNISPIPQDLNDLIAYKKGISIKEAFEFDRGELAFGFIKNQERIYKNTFKERLMESYGFPGEKYDQKHNSLFDAKVTKTIFNYLTLL